MQQATRDLGTGLDHVNDAIKAIAPGSDVAALLKNEFTAAITATGLAAQLGLSVPNPPQYDGITLSYGVSTAAASTVAGPVPLHVESAALNAGLRLADGTFDVTVDLRGLGFEPERRRLRQLPPPTCSAPAPWCRPTCASRSIPSAG